MRVGVDMISAGSGFAPAAGGMISYYDGLLSELCNHPDVTSVAAFVSPWNAGLAVPNHAKIDIRVCTGLPRRRAGRVAYEQLVLPLLARQARVDALLLTCNIRPLLLRCPSVVVLQSLQHFLIPGDIGRAQRLYLDSVVPRSLTSADMVIAVTETERIDAIKLFGLDPRRITTVYHGMSNWASVLMNSSDEVTPYRLSDGRPFLLIVSRLYSFKNHRRLIEAFARLVRDDAVPHALVVVGGDADVTRAELEEFGRSLGVADRLHCLGPTPQEAIPGLFTGAAAVAYVSLYETFGHPVLEAFAFGKPLVTSSTGATAEVAGGAAVLVDPYDVDSMVEGLRAVLLDDDVRARLGELGPRRAAEFTWRRCAAGTYQALVEATARQEYCSPPASTAPCG